MRALGLSTDDGDPTETAEGLSNLVKGFTGLDAIALWKAGEAVFTKRGRDNLKNVVNMKTGFVSSVKSFIALLVGEHSPAEVEGTTAVVKK